MKCPFCGSENTDLYLDYHFDGVLKIKTICVECIDCRASGPSFSTIHSEIDDIEKEAIEAFTSTVYSDEIDRLKEERDEARMAICKLITELNQEIGAETLSPKQNAKQLGWEYLFSCEK